MLVLLVKVSTEAQLAKVSLSDSSRYENKGTHSMSFSISEITSVSFSFFILIEIHISHDRYHNFSLVHYVYPYQQHHRYQAQ